LLIEDTLKHDSKSQMYWAGHQDTFHLHLPHNTHKHSISITFQRSAEKQNVTIIII